MKKNKEELDTETSFADMNVEGMRDYQPGRTGKRSRERISRKEYWALVRGAFRSMLPMILCITVGFGLVVLLAYLWLG